MTLLEEFYYIASPENIDTSRLFHASNIRTDGDPTYIYVSSYNVNNSVFEVSIQDPDEKVYVSRETFSVAVSLFYQYYQDLFNACYSELNRIVEFNRNLLPDSIQVVEISIRLYHTHTAMILTVSGNRLGDFAAHECSPITLRAILPPSQLGYEEEKAPYYEVRKAKRGRDDDDDGYDRHRRMGGGSRKPRRTQYGNKHKKSNRKSNRKSDRKSKSNRKCNRKKKQTRK